ncbi:MAG: hypothetical protein P8N15_07590 [Flavobacteriaceae bacterium]|nr:hypothetical protein [Flavobacteriaceae bacterium]
MIRYKIKNPVYLSGDRHIAEVSRKEIAPNYWLYDATSSGLTHSYEALEQQEYCHTNTRRKRKNSISKKHSPSITQSSSDFLYF